MSNRISHLWSIKRFTLRSKWLLSRFIFRNATSFKVVIGGQQKIQSTLHQWYMIRKDREMWQAQNHGFSSRSLRLTSFSSKFMSGTVRVPLSFCPTISMLLIKVMPSTHWSLQEVNFLGYKCHKIHYFVPKSVADLGFPRGALTPVS